MNSALPRPRRRAVRLGAAAVLVGSLVWPAAAAHAVEPETLVALEVDAAVDATDGTAPVEPQAPAALDVNAAVEVAAADEAETPASSQVGPAADPAAVEAEPPAGSQVDPAADPGAGARAAERGVPSALEVDAAVDPETPGSMSGRVTDSTGAPLEGVRVYVQGNGPGVVPVTAADGTWTVDGVPPGPHVLRFLLTGADGESIWLSWNGTPYGTHAFVWGTTLAAGENLGGLDVTFVENIASGTVTADGAPVAGATVGFYRSPSDPSPVRTVTTAADGTWIARWLRPDSYAIRVTPPDGSGLAPAWWNRTATTYGSISFSGSVPRAVAGVDVQLTAESQLTGRVVDEAGTPVADLRVALWTGRARPYLAAYATTAKDGTYTFRGLDAESYTVQISPQFHTTLRPWAVTDFLGGSTAVGGAVWTPVAAQADVAVSDLVLRIGGTVSGTVVGEPGWDGSGISVEFLAPDGTVVARVPTQDRAEGADFSSAGALPAGVYRIRAAMPGDGYWWVGGTSFESARAIEVRPGRSITDVELVLSDDFIGPPPAPAVDLTEANRGGLSVAAPVVAGGTTTITGFPGESVSYVWLAPSLHGLGYGRVGADGTLQVTIPAGVPAGAYRLVVTTPGGFVTGWADVTVSAAPPVPGAAPAPTATPTPVAAVVPVTPMSAGAARRSGALAVTGSDGAWLAGAALAAVLVGAGLVVLRRRSA